VDEERPRPIEARLPKPLGRVLECPVRGEEAEDATIRLTHQLRNHLCRSLLEGGIARRRIGEIRRHHEEGLGGEVERGGDDSFHEFDGPLHLGQSASIEPEPSLHEREVPAGGEGGRGECDSTELREDGLAEGCTEFDRSRGEHESPTPTAASGLDPPHERELPLTWTQHEPKRSLSREQPSFCASKIEEATFEGVEEPLVVLDGSPEIDQLTCESLEPAEESVEPFANLDTCVRFIERALARPDSDRVGLSGTRRHEGRDRLEEERAARAHLVHHRADAFLDTRPQRRRGIGLASGEFVGDGVQHSLSSPIETREHPLYAGLRDRSPEIFGRCVLYVVGLVQHQVTVRREDGRLTPIVRRRTDRDIREEHVVIHDQDPRRGGSPTGTLEEALLEVGAAGPEAGVRVAAHLLPHFVRRGRREVRE